VKTSNLAARHVRRARLRPASAALAAAVITLVAVVPALSAPAGARSEIQLRDPVALAEAKAQAQAPKSTLMVLGDSLARIYNDKAGSPRQGFWSMVAREVGGAPHVVAQGGSGFVKPGLSRCKGRTFLEQLERPSVQQRFAQAGAVIIEGGRNDTQVCTGHGHFADVSTAELRTAVDEFMDEAQRLRGEDDCTIVVTPWGPKGTDQRGRITPVIRRSAEQHGFTFVDTVGLLNERTTTEDGVHPTHAGNLNLKRAILDQSFVQACFY